MKAFTREAVNEKYTPAAFTGGIKAGIPIAVGYLPIAIAFGLLAQSAGVPNYITALMSLLIFAGASQFVGINLLVLGATNWEIILTTFILNLRHFLMTASISRRVKAGTSKQWLALLAFGVTDETFTVASLRKEQQLEPKFIFGLNLLAFSAWNVGTWLGIFLGAGLPEIVQSSMGIALYAMFIGLIVPSTRESKTVLIISLMAVTVNSLLYWLPVFKGLSAGWAIIISTVIASTAGALFCKDGED
ncbi:4-azaleucine resistance probable transporter AzlC [Desulfotomaculum arcticum]|uniref:4-azaleucine resistance probable transporter AzlC n=1 Tax=Desulfotruncus arcticus DSM 17038 TaxID=1121424 RepID=A0A1I2TUZ1_9FIRM|nr:AzlC family ABC transporter permease [Desulfotruncus arcticus]SFG66111.1 4-azaleucine resistance probable transporter AzlC [Desulfotomaculum arcticum] [Desulfotruncus arcticus DSM 17038]